MAAVYSELSLEPLVSFAEAVAEGVERVIGAARRAFDESGWATTDAAGRAAVIHRATA
jgi:acyl-CoA reductase-like NAD-dependent aldehyde dehydrogenase